MSMNHDVNVWSLFENTNTRIYQAFQGIDVLIEDEARCGTPDPMSATWASAYSTWITDKISSQNSDISVTASSWSAAIPTTAKGNKIQSVAQWSSALASLTEKYPMASLTFRMPTWPVGTPLSHRRRQNACPISSKASLSPSALPSTTTGLPVSTDPGAQIRPSITVSAIQDMAPHPIVTGINPTETTRIDSPGVVVNSPTRISADVSYTIRLSPTIASDTTANLTRPWPDETVSTDTTAVRSFNLNPISSATLTITATFG